MHVVVAAETVTLHFMDKDLFISLDRWIDAMDAARVKGGHDTEEWFNLILQDGCIKKWLAWNYDDGLENPEQTNWMQATH